ncbi:hypothetical protein B0J12DRAFT_713599 [Macrophomina phaseolina]|uniref:Wax synthase domain-containing protein n=1 Tax=Macrophomina phaseolina TaxID=35725 RepID=A0ABQ8FY41_9PEZI|nr:hypothetical protein B0J12DRAFT_713599 [Macrophomina phaseolina]
MSNFTRTGVEVAGWTSGPDGRGIFDIIWNSVVTMFLCSWTVLCLNLPPDSFNDWLWATQKLLMTGLVFIGLEFLFQLAIGQWLSATHSVKQFRSLSHNKWTMKHAFFADMGGYVFDVPGEIARFPLTTRKVYYLVHKGYVDIEDVLVEPKVIADRNKSDGITRLITCCQSPGLAITTLELTTLATIFCTLATYLTWMRKSLDVKTEIPVRPGTTLFYILDEAAAAGEWSREPWRRTPLDFVETPPSSRYIYSSYGRDVFRRMCINFWKSKRRPARAVWHVSSIISVSCVVTFWAVDLFAFSILPSLYRAFPSVVQRKRVLNQNTQRHAARVYSLCHATATRLRNLSEGHDPQFAVPLKAIDPRRTIVLIVCFIGLRLLPVDAYKTVQWANYIPHL